jgi:hypothetical protein
MVMASYLLDQSEKRVQSLLFYWGFQRIQGASMQSRNRKSIDLPDPAGPDQIQKVIGLPISDE